MTQAPITLPQQETVRRRSSAGLTATLSVILGAFALALSLQVLAGVYRAELTGHPDEPAHYVTGLMMHDYVRTWPLQRPMRFASEFYLHYPKMALGHWPPFFYILQALWTVPFASDRSSALVLMAVLAAILAFLTYGLVESEYGRAAGLACGACLLLVPTVQQFAGMVMTEIPVALLCLLAAIQFSRYMRSERWQDSAWFGVLASLAIMTKGSGLALAVVPPLALLFARRLYLVRRPSLWLAAAIVALLCGPWYVFTFDMQQNGWTETAGVGFLLRSFPYNLREMVVLTGPALFAAGLVGAGAKVIGPYRRRAVEPLWAALAALVLSVYVFQSLVPASLDIRHLVTAVPAMIAFAAAGIAWLAGRIHIGGWSTQTKAAALAGVVAVAFGAGTFSIPRKGDRGFADMVADIIRAPDLSKSVILISSQYDGEGIFIAEMAMDEKRPGHVILRASKALADSQWNGSGYHTLFADAPSVMRFLDRVPVGVLVMDNTPGLKDHLHHRQLQQVLRDYQGRFQLMGVYPKDGRPRIPGEDVRVYRILGNSRPSGHIGIDLKPMLERAIRP